MSKRIFFHCRPIRIRFFKLTRGGFCPVSVVLEGKVNPVPNIAGRNDIAGQRLKKLETLINRSLSKFRRLL
jgi:hypothetical protein